jgi:membrane-associated protease RseP (regulator of RpoE activity)
MSETIPPLGSAIDSERPIQVWVVHPPRQRYWLHALLLALTIFTTLVVGARMQYNFEHNQSVFALDDGSLSFFPIAWIAVQPSRLLLGIPFSATLMLILLAHEMGHYWMCKYYRISATLPFFIPFPTLIGTMGAFIRIRSPIRSRVALFDIGVAGPIAGFVLALAVLPFALGLSHAARLSGLGVDRIEVGYPLVFQLVHRAIAQVVPAHSIAALPLAAVSLHPIAIAAWVGMFATALNLLPGGQLDGGHIIFSMAPRVHRFVSALTILAMIPAAYYLWVGWLVWAVLLAISSMRHPQVAGHPRISGHRKWVAVFALLMLVLTLTPAPFAHSSLRRVVQEFRGQ